MMRFIGVVPLLLAAAAHAGVDLSLYAYGQNEQPPVYDPGATVSLAVAVSNFGNETASSPMISMQLPPGFRFQSWRTFPTTGGWACSESDGTVRCTTDVLQPGIGVYIEVETRAPVDPAGGRFTATASVTSSAQDDNPRNNRGTITVDVNRVYVVTVTADGGGGSLREALSAAATDCISVPCKVVFSLDAPGLIHLSTPLPPITVCSGFVIDGGRVPDDAPRRVEIRGDRLPFGNGLEIRTSCDGAYQDRRPVVIRDLAIGSFPENGILLASQDAVPIEHRIEECYIGTDATGTGAVPNGLRGIAANSSLANVLISSNIVSANRRSGIALWSVNRASISQSRIGIGVGGVPLPNGASGVFVASNRRDILIDHNTIAHNRDFGIALARGLHNIATFFNSIFDNGVLGVDWGLDGPSRTGDFPPAPQITEAHYDSATDITTIEGIWSGIAPPMGLVSIAFFANRSVDGSGHAEAENPRPEPAIVRTGMFEGKLRGDFRRQLMTAQALVQLYADWPIGAVSELSEGFPVQ
jgi:uncharacterized repeat protein (TIGR01451 family)